LVDLLFVLRSRPPPHSTLFPYTTLFRSRQDLRPGQKLARKRLVGGSGARRGRRGRTRRRSSAARPCSPRDRDACARRGRSTSARSEEHTSELQSLAYLVCRLLLEKKKKK